MRGGEREKRRGKSERRRKVKQGKRKRGRDKGEIKAKGKRGQLCVSSIGRYIAVIGVKPRLHACKAGTKAG